MNNVKTGHLSLGTLRFKRLFEMKSNVLRLCLIIVTSILVGACGFFIVEKSQIYNLGITALFQGVSRLVSSFVPAAKGYTVPVSWGLSILINIPLALFCYQKIGKRFSALSILSISVVSATVIGLHFLPNNWGLKSFDLFEASVTTNSQSSTSTTFVKWSDGNKVFLTFITGVVFGILSSFFSIFIYSTGACLGGIDWWVFYVVKKNVKPLSRIAFYWSFAIFNVAYILGSYVPFAKDGAYSAAKISNFISPLWFASVTAMVIKASLFNLLYPQFKVVNVKIFSNRVFDIRNHLMKNQFPHSQTINTHIGGYSLMKQQSIEIICFALEFSQILEHTRVLDPKCLVIVTPIKTLDGYFRVSNNWEK